MKNIAKAVEKHRELILAAERYIWQHPETGYKEFKTSAYMAEQFEKLGYTLTYPEDLTGFTAEEWHIRYVGVEHSVPMRDNNFCLEEYLESVEAEPGFLLVEEIPADELPVL